MIEIHAWRYRRRDYEVTQRMPEAVVDVVKSTSALRALRNVMLVPGAKVRVVVPQIVHAKRATA